MAGSRTLKLSILADVDDLNRKLKQANGDVETHASGMEKFGKMASAAFVAAAAAAGAYATKLAVDGVKAAIEDEQAQANLARTLKAATGATDDQIKATEAYISKMQLATGVSDTQLRAAMSRLSLSTNDVAKSQDLLALALDISKARSIPLENVANALGKAYDGQTTSLGKLGLGLSSAELKTMSFDQTQRRLSDLFGGAAAANAETFQGKIDILKERFGEFQEGIGSKMIPVLMTLFNFIDDKLVPAFEWLKKNAIDPITEAIIRNKDTFQALGEMIMNYLVPVFTVSFAGAIKFIGTILPPIIDIIAKVAEGIMWVVNKAIDGINLLIKAYNAIPFLPNAPTIPKVSAPSISVPKVTTSIPTYTGTSITPPSTGTGSGTGTSTGVSNTSKVTAGASLSASELASIPKTGSAINTPGAAILNSLPAQTNTVTVNIGVVGDPESAARTITDIVQKSIMRGTGGLGGLLEGI